MSPDAAQATPTLALPTTTTPISDRPTLLPVPGRWSFRGAEMQWAEATAALGLGEADVLSVQQVAQFHAEGYCVVPSVTQADYN